MKIKVQGFVFVFFTFNNTIFNISTLILRMFPLIASLFYLCWFVRSNIYPQMELESN